MSGAMAPIAGGGLPAKLDAARQALAEARTDFERVQIRDHARAVAAAAAILDRKDIQIEAAELVQRAERAIAWANPPQKRGPKTEESFVPQEHEIPQDTVRKIRAAHGSPDNPKVSDERFEELAVEAREKGEPLTRARLKEEGKAVRKAKVVEERAARQEAARAKTAPMPEGSCIVHAPCHHLPNWVEAASLDAIFTDPPYEESALPVWDDLAKVAATTLKPGGVLLAITGHAWLPQILDRLRVDGLSFRWIIAYTYPKSRAPMHGRGVSVGWKPLVAFTRDGAKPARMSNDVFHAGPKGAGDKATHEWGQTDADMEAIAREWTEPGWHVADPFCGAGSLIVAAKRAGCIVTGCDIDEAHVNTTREKLA